LHAPGKTAEQNLRFSVFIVETLMGVWKHNGLLKASIMSATNAHRLGANEAPPAIISSFLGKQLSELLDHIEKADRENILDMNGKQGMKMDIPEIPELFIDNTDRNRTSPFAFTGNRFEFRAVGSEANCASAMIALNSAVAEALVNFKKRVDAHIPELTKKLEGTGHNATFHAIIDVLREDIKTCKPIRFDGNGYSDEWVVEAEKRGLDVEKSCPKIFERYLDPESIEMFESLGVMTEKELIARNEVKWETYTKKIQIEARVLGDLSMNHIIPVATRYQSALLENVENMADIFSTEKAERLSSRNIKLIEEIAERTSAIESQVEELINARREANKIEDEHLKAIAYHDMVEPKLDDIRYQIDKLELIVDDSLWPLPKYRELLFIR
ncbi:MAG: glutamine synthetase type III, partial [Prevotella sp.]|nr:glutamine synthetase type III [Prevotella sp.]